MPALPDMTRQEIEDHLEAVRARRLVATITYYDGVNAKLEKEHAKHSTRRDKQYEMLRKELEAVDKAIAKVESRVEVIDVLESNLNIIQSQQFEHKTAKGNE